MPRFRFVAADSFGQVNDGTIDAAGQTDARNKLAANGLAVRELEEFAATSNAAPPVLPHKATVARSVEPAEPPPRARPTRPELVASRERGSRTPLFLAIAALGISLSAAAYVLYRDPPWGRLSRYDFSTAERAYLSQLRIEANGDLLAMIELQRKLDERNLREKLNSLKIDHSEMHQGKAVLFISYEANGNRMHEVSFYEQHPDHSNLWRQTHISVDQIRATNQRLADEIQSWLANNNGGGFPATGPRW
jgi:hypothetical protein